MKILKKVARKDYPEFEIKKWDTYYEWCFYKCTPRKSLTYPTARQLTNNEHELRKMDFEDMQNELNVDDFSESHEFESKIDEIKEEIEWYKEELQERLENIPEQLQESSVLNERIEELESWISDLENISIPDDDDNFEEELWDSISEVQNISY